MKLAFAELYLKNENTGQLRVAPVGICWPFLIFGGFVPLYRKDYVSGFIWIGAIILTSGLASIVGADLYNKRYLKRLINEGYKIKSATMPIEQISSKLKLPLEVLNDN